jgi:hypothetical protein
LITQEADPEEVHETLHSFRPKAVPTSIMPKGTFVSALQFKPILTS